MGPLGLSGGRRSPLGGRGGDRGGRSGGRRESKPSAPVDVDTVYEGSITGIKSYGVFVEVQPGRDGLCHISEMLPRDLKEPFEQYSMGDKVSVKVLQIDDDGRIKLSMRAAEAEGAETATES